MTTPSGGGINHRCAPAKAELGFHPLLTTCESTVDAPMLHHHSTSADMWDPCTGAPRWQAFVRRRPRHTHRQLLLAPRSPPPPPPAPLAPTGLLHRTCLSRQSGLPPSAAPLVPSRPPSLPPAPLAPSRPLLPSAALLCAKLVSDPSTERCRAGQMQLSPTSSASQPRPPCLR
jgi:hypothetical protein